MGILYSRQTNLLSQCTSFQANSIGTQARIGDNVEVYLANFKEGEDTSWCVTYETGQTKKRTCAFTLGASSENKRVKNIRFMLSDASDNSGVYLILDIARVGRDRLRGGITSSCHSGEESMFRQMFFERDVEDLSIETHIAPYGCSKRGGLVVLELKKLRYSRDAYMVNVAHYYINDEVGLSVAAKVRRNKNHGFVVEVEGPFVHPSADLFKVVEQTCRTGIWSPGACSHCNNGSGSSLSDKKIREILKGLVSSDQSYTGLINASGYTNGALNNCVIFIDCKV